MKTINILFWNINQKDLTPEICFYAYSNKVDILVLIENTISPADLLRSLNSVSNKYFFCNSNPRKISIFTAFDSKLFASKVTKSKFLLMVELNIIQNIKILFGAVHLSSKLTASNLDHQKFIASEIKKDIEDIESRATHNNTIIVGDFNMNPFEPGMVHPDAFNASMCRSIARNKTRSVNGLGFGSSIQHRYFYNPMWSFLGDLSNFSPGTYYLYGNDFNNHYRWNMLDQILIRPDLINNFVSRSVKIIEKDSKGRALIDSGRKSRSTEQLTDHLPVFFTMNFS